MSNRQFLPNLFILGAAKCGTTTLHAYLDGMPDVCMSNPKEPFFFEAEYERGLDHYRRKYYADWKNEQLIGDARHRNLYLPYVAERIHQVNPDAKLIVIMRNPVDRALSHWHHRVMHGRDSRPFSEAIGEDLERIQKGLRCDTPEEIAAHARYVLDPRDLPTKGDGLYRTYLDTGYYHEQIQRYLKIFSREQLKLILLEDLVEDPRRVIGSLIAFLDLNPTRNRFEAPVHANPARRAVNKNSLGYLTWKLCRSLSKKHLFPKSLWKQVDRGVGIHALENEKPTMTTETRLALAEHFRPHNIALGQLMDRDFSHWK